MATSSASVSVARSIELLPSECNTVERSLELLVASVRRAMNSEKNSDVRAIRAKELASIEALLVKFR